MEHSWAEQQRSGKREDNMRCRANKTKQNHKARQDVTGFVAVSGLTTRVVSDSASLPPPAGLRRMYVGVDGPLVLVSALAVLISDVSVATLEMRMSGQV